MNNILTFEDYKKMSIKQVESVIYRQFIEDDIKEEEIVDEGLIRKAINKSASKFIQNALADEIEKGKELEKSIKKALDGLDKGFEEIKKRIDTNNKQNNSKLDAIEKVKDAIKAVQSQTFDTLTMIGSEGEIDFAGFLGSSTVITAAHFGVLFSPISAVFMTRKAYKYFLGIIKQTIRRNLLIIQLNFDQFENLILQKSFETDDDSEFLTMNNTLNDIISAMQKDLINKDGRLKKITGGKHKDMMNYLKEYEQMQKNVYKARKENDKRNPLSSLWQDQHNNTYTRTLEQIKQYINDDSQKELDSLKNSIQKMAGNDPDLIPFGELMISAAEEYAVHTNHGINNNFIKMSSVFNLENQKKLIELIVETQKENEEEIDKKLKELKAEDKKKESEENVKKGKDIYDRELSGKTYTFDEFEDKFSDDDVTSLMEYFITEEGDKEYKELIDKNHLYKYLIPRPTDVYFNNLLDSIYSLDIVEISSMSDFFEKFTSKKQALYYIMSERSIKYKLKDKDSDPYFGFNIDNDDVNDNILKDDFIKDYVNNNSIFSDFIKPKKFKGDDVRKRYFLTFKNVSGNNLFDILHKEFKTEMFESDGKYISNISTKNKDILINIINKHLNLGKNIPTQLTQYLVRLEAHMLLKKQKDWFVVKDDDVISGCFGDDFSNKNAFVELSENEFKNMKKLLEEYTTLRNNDFKPVDKKDEDETK